MNGPIRLGNRRAPGVQHRLQQLAGVLLDAAAAEVARVDRDLGPGR